MRPIEHVVEVNR